MGIVFLVPKSNEKELAMKRFVSTMIFMSFLGVFFVGNVFSVSPEELSAQAVKKAEEGAPITPDQVIARVEKAAKLVKAEGKNSIDKFKGNSEFIGNGTYIWIHDLSGKMIVHPLKETLDGRQILGMKDPNGKPLFSDMNDLCIKSGAGWVAYIWPKPGSDAPVQKISYVKLVKADRDYVVGCGIYCDKATADKLLATNPK